MTHKIKKNFKIGRMMKKAKYYKIARLNDEQAELKKGLNKTKQKKT
jgi:hypothetical protein